MTAAVLADFLARHRGMLVLTGAGCSAAAGIPTYRDQEGTWQRSTPIQHQEFMRSEPHRRRYWARSFFGFPAVARATPTRAHHALADLSARGYCSGVITQNVDGLHQQAGQPEVFDLHGNLHRVLCMTCHKPMARSVLQERLADLNQDLAALLGIDATQNSAAPDGDADIPGDLIDGFSYPNCEYCGGLLKPDVVFFGGAVDRGLIDTLKARLAAASGLLVIGSSLQVFSGFRFCRWAAADGLPIVSVNPGRTRADDLLELRITGDCQAILPRVAADLP